jgi:hypothetical protein
MGSYQLGSGVGTVVGPADDDKGSIGDNLGTGTAAGQALILTGIAFALLLITVGREAGGVVGKVGRVVEFVVIVAAASAVAQWAGRTYASQYPDGPLAAGVRFDL